MSIEFNSEGTSTYGDTLEAPSRGVNEKIDCDIMIFATVENSILSTYPVWHEVE